MHLRILEQNVNKTTASTILNVEFATATILLLVLYYVIAKLYDCYCPSNAAVSPDTQNGGRIVRHTGLLGFTKQERSIILEKIFNSKVYDTSNDAVNNNDIEETNATSTIEDKTCPICMDEYEQGDELINGKPCNHVFHKECLLLWLKQRKYTCPCCRIEMTIEDRTCPICMNKYKKGDEVINGRTCNHVFHKECLLLWLVNRNDTCPCCSVEMFTYDEFMQHAHIVFGDVRCSYIRTILGYDPRCPDDLGYDENIYGIPNNPNIRNVYTNEWLTQMGVDAATLPAVLL